MIKMLLLILLIYICIKMYFLIMQLFFEITYKSDW
jgi:hypothetical protein